MRTTTRYQRPRPTRSTRPKTTTEATTRTISYLDYEGTTDSGILLPPPSPGYIAATIKPANQNYVGGSQYVASQTYVGAPKPPGYHNNNKTPETDKYPTTKPTKIPKTTPSKNFHTKNPFKNPYASGPKPTQVAYQKFPSSNRPSSYVGSRLRIF